MQPKPRQSTPRQQPGKHDSSCSNIRPALGRAVQREHLPSSILITSNLTVATPDQYKMRMREGSRARCWARVHSGGGRAQRPGVL